MALGRRTDGHEGVKGIRKKRLKKYSRYLKVNGKYRVRHWTRHWTGGHDGTGGGAKNNQLIDDKGSGTALDVAGGGEGILMSCRAAVVLV